jgi:hypothetical protein
MIDTENLRVKLIVAQLDYYDNRGSERADEFYADYVQAYRAYWIEVDPSKLENVKRQLVIK